MAITLRSQSSPTIGTTSLVLNAPSGVQAGDYLIAFVHQQTASATDASSSGWTRIGPPFVSNDATTRITGFFAKFATSSEPSTYTFNTVMTGRSMGFIAAYTGVDTGTPVAFSSGWNTNTNPLNVSGQTATANLFTLEIYAGNFASPNSYALTSYTGGLTALGTAYNPAGTENTAVSRSAMMVWAGMAPSGGVPAHVVTTAGDGAQKCAGMVALNVASGGGGGATTTPTITGHTAITINGDAQGNAGTSTIVLDPEANRVGLSVVPGNWILAIVTAPASADLTHFPTAGAGWTNLVPYATLGASGTTAFGVWAHKRAVGETTYTWTQTTTETNTNYTRMIFVSGADDIANWITGTFQNRDTSGTTLTNVAPSVTATTVHTLALLLSEERTLAAETDTQVTCTNFTKQWFENGQDHSIFIATKDMVSAGATGSVTVTYPNAHAHNGIAGILAIPGSVDTTTGLAIKVSNGSTLVDATFKLADGAGGFTTPGAYKVVKPGYASVTQMLAQSPFYCAHRGGSYDFPEMSLYAYGQSALVGYPALEISLARSSDGVWFGLHDASLDRTSLGTGGGSGTTLVAASMTWAQIQAYNILGSSAAGNTGQANRPYMRWEELMAVYYRTHVIFVDPKVGLAFSSEILNMMDAMPGNPRDHFVAKYYGVAGNTANTTGWAHDASARGYKTWGYFYAADAANYATYAPRWDILGMDYSAAQTYWDQLAAAAPGKPIMGHICPNPAAVTSALSKGAKGLMMSGVKSTIPATSSTPAAVDTLYSGGGGFTIQSSATMLGTAVAENDSRFRYKNAGNWGYGAVYPDNTLYRPASRYPGTYGYPSSCAVEFLFTGERFEVKFKYIAGSSYFRVKVNGHRMTDLPQLSGGVTSGNIYYYHVELGQVVTGALITLEFAGVPFGGIVPDSTATVLSGLLPYSNRTIVQGDSLTQGSTQNTAVSGGTYLLRLADYMGWPDVWNQAIGGTGYTAAGSDVNMLDAARVSDVTANNPSRIIVFAGYNDGSTSISAAATSLVTQYQAACPGVPIYLIGTWSPVYPGATAQANRDAEIEAVAIAKGCYFISPITGRVRNAAGTLVTTVAPCIASSADTAAYIGVDNVHPNDAGHNHLAKWLYAAFMYLQ